MRLHGYFRSSAAHRCRIAFNLKGIAPARAQVHLRDGGQHAPEYLALNPQGLIPALELDAAEAGGDGAALLTQSLAIIEWLEETRPAPPLLPRDPVARARVRAFALSIACDIHPLQNLRVQHYLRARLGQDQSGLDLWLGHWLGTGLAACEAVLAGLDHGGDFAFGDAPGLADVCLVPQIHSAQRFGVDLGAMPRLRAVFDACEALEPFAAARPERQPDAGP